MKKHYSLLLILFICITSTAFSQLYRPIQITEEVKYIPDNGQGYVTIDSTIYLYDQKDARIDNMREEDMFGTALNDEYPYFDSSVSYLASLITPQLKYGSSQSYTYLKDRLIHYALYAPSLHTYADYHYTGTRLDSTSYYTQNSNNVMFKYQVFVYTYTPTSYLAEVNRQVYSQLNGQPTDNYKITYQYDNGGNLISKDYYKNAAYDGGERYTYDVSSNILTYVHLSPGQVRVDSTHYYYNQGSCIKEEGYDLQSGTLFTTRYYQYSSQSSMLLDSLVFYTGESQSTRSSSYYPTISTIAKEVLVVYYDQNNNPVNQYERYRYVYEEYFPTGISNMKTNNKTLTIFPVPTTDILQLRADFTQAGKLEGVVTDMQGRVVYQWEDAAAKQYTKQLVLPQLPAGTYMLQVKSGDKQAVRQFIKQ